ncbi:MAG: thioredoxin domain-containing protein [Elusimicrobia bacterium]|nr:thioredoxin domain-containing protein [Elusimicrobiota bacterium]
MTAPDTRTPEEKAKSKRKHAQVMLVIGYITVACGAAAAFLAWSREGRVPKAMSFLRSAGAPAASLELPSGPRSAKDRVSWRPWGEAAFDEAERAGRLILLDVCPPWSHGCHVMDETTYARPEVVAWIAENVVPVRADPQASAEIAYRFKAPVWPVTALLLPTGEEISRGSLVAPSQFLGWARAVAAAFRRNPSSLKAAAEASQQKIEAERASLLAATAVDRGGLEDSVALLASQYDSARGGFGRAWKLPVSAAHDLLLRLREAEEKRCLWRSRWKQDALPIGVMYDGTLRAWRALEDPVDGGFFRASNSPDWRSPEYEKTLLAQAAAVRDFAAHRALTKDEASARVAERAISFADRRLRERDGVYASGLDADLRTPENGWLAGKKYYTKTRQARQSLGVPLAVGGRPTAANAQFAEAMIEAGVRLLRPALVQKGVSLLEKIEANALLPDGAVLRMIPEPGAKSAGAADAGALADQAAFAKAEVAAFSATKNLKRLHGAKAALRYAFGRLREPGGALLAYAPHASSRRGWFVPVDPDGTVDMLYPFTDALVRNKMGDDGAAIDALDAWAATHRSAIDPVRFARTYVVRAETVECD